MDSTCPTLLMLLSNRRLLLCLPSWCPWGGLHRADRDPLQNDYTARKSGLCGGRLKTQAGKGHILSAGGEIWCIQNVNDCFIFPRVFLFLGRRKAWQHWKPITALKSNNYGLITEMEHCFKSALFHVILRQASSAQSSNSLLFSFLCRVTVTKALSSSLLIVIIIHRPIIHLNDTEVRSDMTTCKWITWSWRNTTSVPKTWFVFRCM